MNQTAYLLWGGPTGDDCLVGIFAQKEEAEAVAAVLPRDYEYRAVPIMFSTVGIKALRGDKCYQIRSAFDGTYFEAENIANTGLTEIEEEFKECSCWWQPLGTPRKRAVTMRVWAASQDDAIKRFTQARNKWRTELGI